MTVPFEPKEKREPAAGKAMGKIGVVTVLFNSAKVLPAFFTSVEAQTHQNFVVYCIDNASTDGSAQACAERGLPYVVIRNENNLGVAAGNNQGIRAALAAGCEYVLFLNNDVEFESDLFERLIEGIGRHGADMTTPKIYFADPSDVIWCAGGGFFNLGGYRPFHRGEYVRDKGQFANDQRVEYTPTCCVLVKSSLFDSVGFMDERYFAYWDDADWMLRAKQAGASLWYIGGARLWHKVSSLTGFESDFSIRYTRRNKAYYLYKHVNRPCASALRTGYSLYYLFRALIPKHRKKATLCFRSWQEGVTLFESTIGLERRRAAQTPQ